MAYNTNSTKNLMTIKAWRGESLTIDLGKELEGSLQAWMKRSPDDEEYRSFTIKDNRYIYLSSDKTSDYYEDEELVSAIEGKWYFDIEQTLDNEDAQTIYTGVILFQNDITNSGGIELDSTPTIDKTTSQVSLVTPGTDSLSEDDVTLFDALSGLVVEVNTLKTASEGTGEPNNISDENAAELTGGSSTDLHNHDSDRARENHTGTQLSETISDFQENVSLNEDVVSNKKKVSYPSADSAKLASIEENAEVNNITDVIVSELTSGDNTEQHFHTSDRDRSNHTGTQLLSTISDAGDLASKDMVSTTDIGDGSVTDEKMSSTGITAGAYTNVNITVNEQGRITLISSSDMSMYPTITRSALSISGGAIDINYDSKNTFDASNILAVEADATITRSNTTNASDGRYFINATSGVSLTFPADNNVQYFEVTNSRWDNTLNKITFSDSGIYEIMETLKSGEYYITISDYFLGYDN